MAPDEIAIVVRHPASSGPLLASVLAELGVPVALEASLPLSATAVGGSLTALCRAASDETATEALLIHLRLDPSLPPGPVDIVERRLRRGDAQTVTAATEGWKSPPRHLARLREAGDDPARLRALARSARELAEGAHHKQAPLVRSVGTGVPFSAVELRAGVAAAELLTELAGIGRLTGRATSRACGAAVEALESASVALWRGPAAGRVRIMSPYRARAARARALFVASLQDGEFPSAAPPDPLLSEERRREIGNPDLRRAEQAEEERYLFHSCVSRPTERLYLSWQSCDEDGTALARSPFVDEVLDLLAPDPAAAEERLARIRGPERAVFGARRGDQRARARQGAGARRLVGRPRRRARTARPRRARRRGRGACSRDCPIPNATPGPLTVPAVLADLGAREVFSANSLEGWITCPYKWFVEHELQPQRLEPEADPLWLGSVVHDALERLYREPPGEDSIPRPGDVGRWRERFAELLESGATERARAPLNHSRRAALERARVQVEAFLDAEAETDTEFRPRPELLEVGFGPLTRTSRDAEAHAHGALRLGDRGPARPHRPDRRRRRRQRGRPRLQDRQVRSRRADAFADEGTLQIQLYMRVAERILGLRAGRRPLPPARRRRTRQAPAREAWSPRRTSGSRPSASSAPTAARPRSSRRALDEAEESADQAAAREMGAGRIGRRPLGGKCPKYCTFQAICRLERAVGAVGEQSGGERRVSADEGQLALAGLEPPEAERPSRRRRRGRRSAEGATSRSSSRPPSRPRRSPRASATPSSRPGRAAARRRVLVDRYCAAIAEDGVEVDRILAFTFTERAAAEMRTRIRRELVARSRAVREAGDAAARGRAAAGGAGDRARLGDDDPRLLPAAARRPPARRRPRSALPRPRRARGRHGSPTGRPTRHSTSCSPPATPTSPAPPPRTSRGGSPQMTIDAHARLRSQGMSEPRLPPVADPVALARSATRSSAS